MTLYINMIHVSSYNYLKTSILELQLGWEKGIDAQHNNLEIQIRIMGSMFDKNQKWNTQNYLSSFLRRGVRLRCVCIREWMWLLCELTATNSCFQEQLESLATSDAEKQRLYCSSPQLAPPTSRKATEMPKNLICQCLTRGNVCKHASPERAFILLLM